MAAYLFVLLVPTTTPSFSSMNKISPQCNQAHSSGV